MTQLKKERMASKILSLFHSNHIVLCLKVLSKLLS